MAKIATEQAILVDSWMETPTKKKEPLELLDFKPPDSTNHHPKDAPLPKELDVMLPPKLKENSKYKDFPGFWEAPDGYGATVSGIDSFFWAIWWLWRVQRQALMRCIAIILCQGVIAYMLPVLVTNLMEAIQHDSREFIGLILLVTALEAASNILEYYLQVYTPSGGGFRPGTMGALVTHFLRLPLHRAEEVRAGSAMPVLQAFTLIDTNINSMVNLMSASTVLVLSVAAFASFSLDLIALQLVCFISMSAYILNTAPRLQHASEGLETGTREFMAQMEELLNLRVSLNLLQIHNFAADIVSKAVVTLRSKFKQLKMTNLAQLLTLDLISTIVWIIILGYGGYKVRSGSFEFESLVTFFSFHDKLLKVVTRIISNLRKMQISAAHLKTVAKVLRARTVTYPQRDLDNTVVPGSIEVHEVDFAFRTTIPLFRHIPTGSEMSSRRSPSPGGGQEEEIAEGKVVHEVLHGLSLDIPAGSKVAVVGRSGSGKSTLLKILARGYQPDSGWVKVGGEFLNHANLGRTIAVCEQAGSAPLLDASVLENIRVGTEATDEECVEAAKKACLIGRVDSMWLLPKGLETQCGAGGKNVSGGVLQRVLIARALVRNTPVVLLDEPLSAQDNQTKTELTNTLTSLTHTATDPNFTRRDSLVQHPSTVVLATHNMDVLKDMDLIAYIQGGGLKDFGSYDDLMKAKGPFWQFRYRSLLVNVDVYGEASVSVDGLQRIWPLTKVPVIDLFQICNLFVTQTFEKGALISIQGDPNAACFVLASGEASEYFNIHSSWGGGGGGGVNSNNKSQDASSPRSNAGGGGALVVPKSFKWSAKQDQGSTTPVRGGNKSLDHGHLLRDLLPGDVACASALFRHVSSLEDRSVTNITTVVAKSRCKMLIVQNSQFQELFAKNPQILAQVIRQVKRRDEVLKEALHTMWQLVMLQREQIVGLARLADSEHPPANQVFYDREWSPPCCFIVQSGRVQVETQVVTADDHDDDTANPNIKTTVLQMGASFGMDRLMGNPDNLIRATSVGEVELLVIRQGMFDSFKSLQTFQEALGSVAKCLEEYRNPDRLYHTWPFNGLPSRNLDAITKNMVPEVYREDDLIINSFKNTQDFYLVAHGTVELLLETSERVFITVTLGPGEVFNHHAHFEPTCGHPFRLVNAKSLSNCVVLRTPKHLVLQVESYLSSFLPLWTSEWGAALDGCDRVRKQLGLRESHASVVQAVIPLQMRVLSALDKVHDFLLEKTDPPLALVVLYGKVEYICKFVESEGKPGTLLLNSTGGSFLKKHVGEGGEEVSADVISAGDTVLCATECLVAVINLSHVLKEDIIERSNTIREMLEEAEDRRMEIVGKATQLQNECLEMERRLGWCRPFTSARRSWRVARLTILIGGDPSDAQFKYPEGLTAEDLHPREYDPAWHLLRESDRSKLVKAIDYYEEKVGFMEPYVEARLAQLDELRAEWRRVGLRQNTGEKEEGAAAAVGPQGDWDLSEERMAAINKAIEERKEKFKTNEANARRDFEKMLDVLVLPADEYHRITSKIKREKGVNQLIALEAQNDELRDLAEPVVRGLNRSVTQLYEDLQVPEDRRTPLLVPGSWEATELLLFYKMEGALRSAWRNTQSKQEKSLQSAKESWEKQKDEMELSVRKVLASKDKEIAHLKKLLQQDSRQQNLSSADIQLAKEKKDPPSKSPSKKQKEKKADEPT